MRLIKGKDKKNGIKWCVLCKPEKVEASHVNRGRGYCTIHALQEEDDGYMTEADYQTWGRL